jgi:RimJ/RimL family protein N-acetyltransferase
MWWHAGTPRIRYERIELRGEGITLRAFGLEDLPKVLAIVQDPDIVRFSHLPRAWHTEEGARDYIGSLPRMAAAGERIDLAIEASQTGALIGHVALREISWRKRSAGVATWIAPEARGRGSSSHAIDLIARWAFSELGLVRLHADPDRDNDAAHHMLERAGFGREAQRGDEPGGRSIVVYARRREASPRRAIPVLAPIRYQATTWIALAAIGMEQSLM